MRKSRVLEIKEKIYLEDRIANLRQNKKYGSVLELIVDLGISCLTDEDREYIDRIYLMPFSEIDLELRRYDDSYPRLDELVFILDLMEKYNVSKKQLIKRIQDIRRINKVIKMDLEEERKTSKVRKKF